MCSNKILASGAAERRSPNMRRKKQKLSLPLKSTAAPRACRPHSFACARLTTPLPSFPPRRARTTRRRALVRTRAGALVPLHATESARRRAEVYDKLVETRSLPSAKAFGWPTKHTHTPPTSTPTSTQKNRPQPARMPAQNQRKSTRNNYYILNAFDRALRREFRAKRYCSHPGALLLCTPFLTRAARRPRAGPTRS